MEPERLYELLTQIIELEGKIKGIQYDKLDMDFLSTFVRHHHNLVDRLPSILSVEELIKYHQYVTEIVSPFEILEGKEQTNNTGTNPNNSSLDADFLRNVCLSYGNNILEERVNRFLNEIKRTCSKDAYDKLEDATRRHFSYNNINSRTK